MSLFGFFIENFAPLSSLGLTVESWLVLLDGLLVWQILLHQSLSLSGSNVTGHRHHDIGSRVQPSPIGDKVLLFNRLDQGLSPDRRPAQRMITKNQPFK